MRPVLAGALLTLFLLAAPAGQELIDRILVVVNGQIITLSDVRAALHFQLVPADVSTDPVAAALQRLIDRRLMLVDVERYAPPEPAPADVETGIDRIRKNFKDPLALTTELTRYGLSDDELRRHVRDTLRINAYLQQRFAAMPQPSADDLVRYYRAHPEEFLVNGKPQLFVEAQDAVRARVVATQRETFTREWLAGLRRRATILGPYLPSR
jgi:hypothetical protein